MRQDPKRGTQNKPKYHNQKHQNIQVACKEARGTNYELDELQINRITNYKLLFICRSREASSECKRIKNSREPVSRSLTVASAFQCVIPHSCERHCRLGRMYAKQCSQCWSSNQLGRFIAQGLLPHLASELSRDPRKSAAVHGPMCHGGTSSLASAGATCARRRR